MRTYVCVCVCEAHSSWEIVHLHYHNGNGFDLSARVATCVLKNIKKKKKGKYIYINKYHLRINKTVINMEYIIKKYFIVNT